VCGDISLSDYAVLEQKLHMTVIAGALANLALAEVINATVTNVGKKCGTILHEAKGAGGTRTRLHRQACAKEHKIGMRPTDSQMQKADRIKDRMRDAAKGIPDGLNRKSCGAGTVGVATHTVYGDEQYRLLSRNHQDPVLVFFPITDQAQICILDSQGDLTRISPCVYKKARMRNYNVPRRTPV
jgi:hypothetical protein